MPYKEVIGLLTDIGTEELAHMEMIAAIIHQLTRNMTIEQIKEAGLETYFVDHTAGIYPASAAGVPWTASYIQSSVTLSQTFTKTLQQMPRRQRTTYIFKEPKTLDMTVFSAL